MVYSKSDENTLTFIKQSYDNKKKGVDSQKVSNYHINNCWLQDVLISSHDCLGCGFGFWRSS